MAEATSATSPIADDRPIADELAAFKQNFDRLTEPTAPAVPTPTSGSTPTNGSTPPPVKPDLLELPALLAFADKFLHPLRASEVVIGVTTIFAWICLFLAGIVVETESVRELISSRGASTYMELLGAWFILLTSYTVTNYAFLACLAAVIGKFSRRSLAFESASNNGLTRATVAKFGEVMVLYSVAIARGFVIYLMLTGGLLLLSTSTVTKSSVEEYVKLASTISILAFMAGYDAEIFKRAIDRISTFSSEGKTKP